ncbi:hypothetical protein EYF80_040528 [Liparis tanakae]|uniref:Uncharacterized protein n=1 Tax=Liparis tanakae TaxID=230148 RepID=A0A4Z2G7X5_9TELE|nr:hypothetical protein EYF80_040528 [Liparis tanakae]
MKVCETLETGDQKGGGDSRWSPGIPSARILLSDPEAPGEITRHALGAALPEGPRYTGIPLRHNNKITNRRETPADKCKTSDSIAEVTLRSPRAGTVGGFFERLCRQTDEEGDVMPETPGPRRVRRSPVGDGRRGGAERERGAADARRGAAIGREESQLTFSPDFPVGPFAPLPPRAPCGGGDTSETRRVTRNIRASRGIHPRPEEQEEGEHFEYMTSTIPSPRIPRQTRNSQFPLRNIRRDSPLTPSAPYPTGEKHKQEVNKTAGDDETPLLAVDDIIFTRRRERPAAWPWSLTDDPDGKPQEVYRVSRGPIGSNRKISNGRRPVGPRITCPDHFAWPPSTLKVPWDV